MLSTPLLQHVSLLLKDLLNKDVHITNVKQVFGGDINQTYTLETNAGKFFLKTNSNALPLMFEKESNGLTLLKSANALYVPTPLLAGTFAQTGFLVMEFIDKGEPSTDFWQQFGYGLASLHMQTHPYFGLPEDNYIGTIPQKNSETANWADFYAHQRILPLMQQALQQQKCTVADVKAAEKLCGKLGSIFPNEKPCLLHGDLWGGNFMVGYEGQPIIFDPAVYYGHREMDIAMTMLFGGFDTNLYNYYSDVNPLQPGWQQRVQLCQLYPLLVHLVLFGGHYYKSVSSIIELFT